MSSILENIPSELQLPTALLLGIFGFLLVINGSLFSAKPIISPEAASVDATPKKEVQFTTPEKDPNKPKMDTDALGTVKTPEGRRSARLARKK